jgi:hypothetical protein
MPDVTIVIPVAPYHLALVDRAIASANAQTVDCEVFVFEDAEGKGAGFARNRALEEVTTKFVVFLDADDEIAPNYIERCLSVWKPGRYVYTDYLTESGVNRSSDNPWQASNGEWHVITALLPTDAVKRVGGFDESVAGAEDTLLYWALTRAGICGIALHEPLFTYGKEGRRARAFVESAAYRPTMLALIERYGDDMCCGGESPIKTFVPDQPGDVQALALWGGNRRELGIITGRLYPRGGNMQPMSVDPRDVNASPEKWQAVVEKPAYVPTPQPAPAVVQTNVYAKLPTNGKVLDGVGQLVEAVTGAKVQQAQEAAPVMTAEQLKATIRPDAGKVRKLASKKK